MRIKSFKDMYIAELQELVSAERQLDGSLQRMGQAASHAKLKDALLRHREETAQHEQRLESILKSHGADTNAHTDQAMQSLIEESEKMLRMLDGKELCDAGMIASAQRLKHYEIAAYGTIAALAGQLGFRDDQQILHQTLEEEKRTDALLSGMAKQDINPAAVAA